MDETAEFRRFRKESLNQLKKLKAEDVVIFDDDEIEENYTLIARLDDRAIYSMVVVIDDLKSIDDSQYYYPTEQLHLTILGNMSLSLDRQRIVTKIDRVIRTLHARFRMCGLGSGSYCSSMSCYPEGFSLYRLREMLRGELSARGDDYSKYLRHYEYMGWINYLRYLQTPKEALLSRILSYSNRMFGYYQPRVFELYKTRSKVLDLKKSELVERFILA